jgi:putative ABC transport system permease protein
MIKNFIKLVFRNIKRNKGYSFVNISGLVIGMTCFLLIMLFVQYELSFDNFHNNPDRIFRLVCQLPGDKYGMSEDVLAVSPAPLANSLITSFPEVEAATKFNIYNRVLLSQEDNHFYERGLFADKNFMNIFTFKLINGNINTLLDNPENIVISQRLAQKFFDQDDPVGKTLTCYLGDFTVVGIVENVPENSHIQFDWIMPFVSQFRPNDRERRLNMWNWDSYYSFVKLHPGSDLNEFEKKVNTLTKTKYAEWEARTQFRYFLQPLDQVHLTSGYRYELGVTTDMSLIRLFVVVAVFILLIACINTVNLATAYASKRSKEVGIKKVIGSAKHQLVLQFTGESLLISTLSLIVAIILVDLCLPFFNQIVERSLNWDFLMSTAGIFGLGSVIILTGLISGIYPSIILSSLKPVSILNRQSPDLSMGFSLRNILVLFQFSVAVILMIASIIIFQQIDYLKNKDLGFSREQILVLNRADPGIRNNFNQFKYELLQDPEVIDITTSSQLPTNIGSATGTNFQTDDGEAKSIHYQYIGIDYNFVDMFEMEIVMGRNFSKVYGNDSAHCLIVNENFIKKTGWKNPIGKEVPQVWSGPNDQKLKIVGIVKDFHARPMHSEIKPVIMSCRPNSFWVHVRIQSDELDAAVTRIEESYNKLSERYPFEYFFLDDQFNRMYQSEQKLGQIILYANILAIFIACLGIFGLAIYTAEKRTKEIGVRKVLGASVPGIITLLSWNFTKWVLIANIIAWPLGYYFMTKWLQNFTYRITVDWWIFIVAGLLTLVIAIITVVYHAIKTALLNPVESLRYE